MRRLFSVFIISIFLSLNYGTLIYVNSSFLGSFLSSSLVSLVFISSAGVSILAFFTAPRLVNALGKEKLLFLLLLSTALSTLLLASSDSGLAVALFFISYSAFHGLSYYCLDIFVEEASLDSSTGEMRGIYLTFVNAGIILGPLIVALVASGEEFSRFYLVGAIALSIPLILSALLIPGSKKLHPILETSFSLPFKAWWHNRDVRAVTLSRFILETFFAVMVIYTPVYLHTEMGFAWSELGIAFTIMLLPFVMFEWPAGELADRLWGEKELMSIGFFLMGTSLITMPFLSNNLTVWIVVLFISRVGASLVEVTTESYFFKKIKAHEIGFLSIFRLSRSVSTILGAFIGAATLYLFSFEKIFFAVAFVVLWGLYESLYLKDTR
jgi:MFS family permease